MMKFEVLVLGSSSATPMYGRHPTAQLIHIQDQLLLVDCGEGTQMQLSSLRVKANKIRAIFISHLHGDHYLGLTGLLSSMHLMGRKSPLEVYGPPALKEILELQFFHSQTTIAYPLTFHPTHTDGEQLLLEDRFMKVSSFPLNHRIPCTGFRVEEPERPPTLDAEKVRALGVPRSFYNLLKQKVDYVDREGRVHAWQELTQPAAAPRKYAFCSDTAATGPYLNSIQGVDLLYHEATFLHDMKERAVETFHSTARQAAEVAQAVGARKLLIGHYSARYKDLQALHHEAKQVFPETALAVEGRWYRVGE